MCLVSPLPPLQSQCNEMCRCEEHMGLSAQMPYTVGCRTVRHNSSMVLHCKLHLLPEYWAPGIWYVSFLLCSGHWLTSHCSVSLQTESVRESVGNDLQGPVRAVCHLRLHHTPTLQLLTSWCAIPARATSQPPHDMMLKERNAGHLHPHAHLQREHWPPDSHHTLKYQCIQEDLVLAVGAS